jgi:hypothetical protein
MVSQGQGLSARRQWVRVVHPQTGRELAAVVVRMDQPELIVLRPLSGLLHCSPDEAVAVAACLSVAVHGFDHVDVTELEVQADTGDGWRSLIPEHPHSSEGESGG